MVNLATETSANSADPETFATLTNYIATLKDQLASIYIWAQSKEAELKQFPGGPAGSYVRKSYNTKNDNYCWSHEYQV
jgi:hypothetical protein